MSDVSHRLESSLQQIMSMASLTSDPAMMKALLSAPQNFVVDGTASMFTATDYANIMSGGRCRKNAILAHDLMVNACEYLLAYARLDPIQIMKHMADAEIRCVMWVHGKKSSTRAAYDTLYDIAMQTYKEV